MKTILITGADGFIGRRMMAAVRARGWWAIGLDRAAPSGAESGKVGRCEGMKVAEDGGRSAGGRQAEDAELLPTETGGREAETPNLSPSYMLPVTPAAAWIVADITADTPIELPPGIDAIIHLAGKAHALAEVAQDEAEYFRINTVGTRRMLEAAQRADVRAFVLFSTVKAAGDRPLEVVSSEERVACRGGSEPETRNPKSETLGGCAAGACEHADLRGNAELQTLNLEPGAALMPLDELCSAPPDTPYGQSKRAAEALVLEGGYVPHPVVLRPCLVYGPTPKGNLEKMITAVRRGRFPPLPEVGNKRSMVHVDDVIAAALLAAEHPAAVGQIFVVADNEPFSTRQLFEWICTAAGRRVPGWTMPLWVLRLLGRVGDGIGRLRGRRFVFDSDALAKLTGSAWYSSAKLQRELGWKPEHTLQKTMGKMVGR